MKTEQQGLALAEPVQQEMQTLDPMTMVERLASDPNVDVSKLERLIAMNERAQERLAKESFNTAFVAMATEIPEITERGQIKNKEGQVQSQYARFEDIQKVVKPILQRHGFSLSFRSEFPDKKTVKVIGVLSHHAGHARESEFMSEADTSGSKNAIQGLGSAVSYGRRYTAIDLLNITSRGKDDDGQGTDKLNQPPAPAGFDEWLINMEGVAANGLSALEKAFADSKREFREHVTRQEAKRWAALKTKAGKVKA